MRPVTFIANDKLHAGEWALLVMSATSQGTHACTSDAQSVSGAFCRKHGVLHRKAVRLRKATQIGSKRSNSR